MRITHIRRWKRIYADLAFYLLTKLHRSYLGSFPQMAVLAFDHIGRSINAYGRYEAGQLEALTEYLHTKNASIFSGAVLDVGANIGNHTVYFSSMFSKVYSFEPNPDAFQLLQFNTRTITKNNIACHNAGLSDQPEVLRLAIDPTNIGSSSFLDKTSENYRECTLSTIERIADINETVSLIKVDVEGYELKALKGLSYIILRDSPMIVFEQLMGEFTHNTSPAIEFLSSHGYRFSVIKTFPDHRNKYIKTLLEYLLGVTVSVEPITHFQSRTYPMIIAEKTN
jgi:FkbM family methyltransferase